MKLSKLIPVIYTADLPGTINFYRQTLGFTCLTDRPEAWAMLECDGINLMISIPNEHIHFDQPNFTGSFYFNTDHVDEIWNKIKDAARICYPLEDFEYGMREFAIYDNNGYLLQFGQNIAEIGDEIQQF